jgi:hypothetical protein
VQNITDQEAETIDKLFGNSEYGYGIFPIFHALDMASYEDNK